MKKSKNVQVLRKCNVVKLSINNKTPEGKYITEWLDKRNMLSDVAREIINLEFAGATSYTIKVITKKCRIAKLLARKMQEKVNAAMQLMPRLANTTT